VIARWKSCEYDCTLRATLSSVSPSLPFFRSLGTQDACASVDGIEKQIRVFRGHPVLLDSDLADICGVPAAQLLDEVHHHEPLAGELCFAPQREELVSHGASTARLNSRRYAFTEHGAFMVAMLLQTPAAIAVSVQIVRAFVRHRERCANHATLAHRFVH
jgi:hypothetical protein